MSINEIQALQLMKIQLYVSRNDNTELQSALTTFSPNFALLVEDDKDTVLRRIQKTFTAKYRTDSTVITSITALANSVENGLSLSFDFSGLITDIISYEREAEVQGVSSSQTALDAMYSIITTTGVPYELIRSYANTFVSTVLEIDKAFNSHGGQPLLDVIDIIESNV